MKTHQYDTVGDIYYRFEWARRCCVMEEEE